MDDFQDTLRRLTIRDDRFIAAVLASDRASTEASALDCKAHALVRLGALIAIDAAPQSYAATVEAARLAGATDEEIAGTLVATLSVVGPPRVVSAAPKLGLALGYDLDAALESTSS
jgi:alkylhydroperoxidase/carboxymuconolactone decarboxylase family protein YurZ